MVPLLLTGGGPGNATLTPVLYMYQGAITYGNYGFGMAVGHHPLRRRAGPVHRQHARPEDDTMTTATARRPPPSRPTPDGTVRSTARRRRLARRLSLPANVVLGVVALLTYVPIYFMVNNALRTGPEMQVVPVRAGHRTAVGELLARLGGQRLRLPAHVPDRRRRRCSASPITTLASGYAFARLRFREKEVWFFAVFGLLLIPGFITLIPLYVQIVDFGIIGTSWGLILPYLGRRPGARRGRAAQRRRGDPRGAVRGGQARRRRPPVAVRLHRGAAGPAAGDRAGAAQRRRAVRRLRAARRWCCRARASTVSVAITELHPAGLRRPTWTRFNIQLAAFTIASLSRSRCSCWC